ncbi:MAG: hypothetical protein HY424_02650 [Candidatus Levybacteria bacterium]|nr:hypothetical protein [Candidatus Levybacteria bacterium]
MPTLNKTKKETKIILKWGGIFLLIIFLFLNFGRITGFLKESFGPPPPPKASFGKLPNISFPSKSQENIIYTLDTVSGTLPNFSDRAKVYKISFLEPTLLALDKTQEKVYEIGFNSKGTQIAPDVYQWIDQTSDLQRRITINIFSSDFTLSSPYLITPSLQTLKPNDQDNAVELAKSFLSSMSLLPADLDLEKTKMTYYSIEKSALVKTSKISNAKIVRVDFFQKDLDSLPIYYEKGTSNFDFLIGKENNQLKVVGVRYFYKNISKNSSTYAIKSASEAFLELKQGKAYLASKPQGAVEIAIRKVLLGYYIGEKQQDFLMPIVVFIGDDNFIAYVSAVKDEWISN